MGRKPSLTDRKVKTSVSISTYYREFIKREIDTGRYDSASQVFIAGLKLLEIKEFEDEKKREGRIKSQINERLNGNKSLK